MGLGFEKFENPYIGALDPYGFKIFIVEFILHHLIFIYLWCSGLVFLNCILFPKYIYICT